jgi:peptide/nickel transport system permease protein
MGLKTYVIRRLLLLIPTLIGITLLIFAIMQFLPVNIRAMMYITDIKELDDLPKLIEEHGLAQPVYIQYFRWLKEVFVDHTFGVDQFNQPVFEAIMARLPATIELAIFSIPPIIIIGIVFGTTAAVHKDKAFDHTTRLLAIMGTSLPSFWLGIVLLSIFFAGLGWFPPQRWGSNVNLYVSNPSSSWKWYTHFITIDGLLNGRPDITLDGLRHLVLPVTVLTLLNIALIMRVMRSSMLESLSKDYITAAKAKGLTKKEVINKHARKNALIPVVTLSGLLAAGLLTGVVITETVFDLKGVGAYAAESAAIPCIPVVLAYALLSGFVFVMANLIVDLLYAYLDPRIRLG